MKIIKKVELTPEEKKVCKESVTKILEVKSKVCLQMGCEGLDCSDCPIHKAIKTIEEGAILLSIDGGA